MLRGPRNTNPIKLEENEIIGLQELLRARKTSQAKVMRARIILLSHEHPEWSNTQIGQEVGCSARTVYHWRKRWNETKDLEDLPRPGAPRRFSPRSQGTSNSTGM